ncbi:MAG: NUDIX domain-containing protein [Bacteroidales bacterium]|jgi:8-oxo-dGTP pyrophosphatase MutT (NUDIX family)
MYKVFYDNRAIFFIDDFETWFAKESGLFYQFISVEHLQILLKTFTKIKEIPQLFIISEDIEATFAAYQTLYTLIEAGGGVVESLSGEILAIKRHGKWDLPKGKIEDGETPEQGALREVEEECGIKDLTANGLLTHTYHTYLLNEQPILKKTHWYSMHHSGDAQLAPQTEEGITEVSWFPKNQLDAVINNTYASIIEVLNELN